MADKPPYIVEELYNATALEEYLIGMHEQGYRPIAIYLGRAGLHTVCMALANVLESMNISI